MGLKVVVILSCFFLIAIVNSGSISAYDQNCKVDKIYEELQCSPVYKSVLDKCPMKFVCPDSSSFSTDKCYYRGGVYNINDKIGEDVGPPCTTHCECQNRTHSQATIQCVDIECPEDFDWNPEQVERYNDLKSCCASDLSPSKSSFRCSVEGRSYQIGERMDSNSGCFSCLCTEKFDNTTSFNENVNCNRVECGIELHRNEIYAGCTPIYFKDQTCCPIEYRCPSKSDSVIRGASVKGSETCTYGNLRFSIGDLLETDDGSLKCECLIPPFITCIKSNS